MHFRPPRKHTCMGPCVSGGYGWTSIGMPLRAPSCTRPIARGRGVCGAHANDCMHACHAWPENRLHALRIMHARKTTMHVCMHAWTQLHCMHAYHACTQTIACMRVMHARKRLHGCVVSCMHANDCMHAYHACTQTIACMHVVASPILQWWADSVISTGGKLLIRFLCMRMGLCMGLHLVALHGFAYEVHGGAYRVARSRMGLHGAAGFAWGYMGALHGAAGAAWSCMGLHGFAWSCKGWHGVAWNCTQMVAWSCEGSGMGFHEVVSLYLFGRRTPTLYIIKLIHLR